MPAKIILITGTDTGVGKTLLTGLLLAHLRQSGVNALALKPFCSGSRQDVQLLQALQERVLSADEINPFYFPEPLAPLVAGRLHRKSIPMAETLRHIEVMTQRCDCLLIEGIGGLLVPLGPLVRRGVPTAPPKAKTKATPRGVLPGAYTVLDLIATLHGRTIVVSRNRLGTINHTLLTVAALQYTHHRTRAAQGAHSSLVRASEPGTSGRTSHSFARRSQAQAAALPKVVLMNSRRPDLSASANPRFLSELLAPTPLFLLPFLRGNCHTADAIKRNAEKLHKILGRLLV